MDEINNLMDNLDTCKEFIGRARDIVQQEIVFEMRHRMTTELGSKESIKQRKLHEAHQITAWQIVKKMYVENEAIIQIYRQESREDVKELIDNISRVIHDEINEIILKD